MPGIYFVGVDIGTGSARAALVDAHGRVQQMHVKAIQTWNPLADHYEQSSEDIWSAVCECVRVSGKIPNGFFFVNFFFFRYLRTCDFVYLLEFCLFSVFADGDAGLSKV